MLIETFVVLAFFAAWLVLEWQCRRLDRLRAKENDAAETNEAEVGHPPQQSLQNVDKAPPAGLTEQR